MDIRMPNDYYGYTDKVLEVIRKFLVKKWRSYKANVLNIDQTNALNNQTATLPLGDSPINLYWHGSEALELTHEVFSSCNELVEKKLLDIAKHTAQKIYKFINEDTIEELLELELMGYDPVDRYVYRHEVERKEQRCAEAVISIPDKSEKSKEIDKQLKYYYAGVSSKAISVTDSAVLTAYKSAGIKKIQWITNIDGRECQECHDRHLKIYDIDKVPPKPHRGCRCKFKPVR